MNNTFTLRKAERKQAKLRIGLSAPSGAGKTYSALLLAYGITGDWSKVALIDTESGSGELYAHLGDYNTIQLEAPYSPERYIEALQACIDAGMQTVIIDSASHEWDGKGGVLQINEALANAKYRGNKWAAWNETTPRHQKFLEAIVTAPVHIITCVRNKTDTIMTDDKKVKKVGIKEIQRDGYEYELTVNLNIDRDTHMATASKDRTELFINSDPFLITSDTGRKLIEWANSGTPVVPEAPKAPVITRATVREWLSENYPEVEQAQYGAFIKEHTDLDPNKESPDIVLTQLKIYQARNTNEE